MKNSDIRKMSSENLQSELVQLENSYVALLASHRITPIRNTAEIRMTRRQIARLKTEINSREIASITDKAQKGEVNKLNADDFVASASTTLTLPKVRKILNRLKK